MRIDVHAYIGHWPFRQLRGTTAADLVARLDAFTVDCAWVGNIHGMFYRNSHQANEELAKAVAPYRDRLVPWGTLNPTYAGWEHDLNACVEQLGIKGLRLYPQYHGYKPGDEACMAIVQAAAARGLPVAFTHRLIDMRQQSWMDPAPVVPMEDMAKTVAAVPNAKYLFLHAFPSQLSDEATTSIYKADVLFDTVYAAGVPVGIINAYPLGEAVAKFGVGRFAFGTVTPFRDYESNILRIETFEEGDVATREALWHGNAVRFLG